MHPYSELSLHLIPLIQNVHSSITTAPSFNIIKALGSRIDKRQHKVVRTTQETCFPTTHTLLQDWWTLDKGDWTTCWQTQRTKKQFELLMTSHSWMQRFKRLNGKRLGNTFNNLMKTPAQEYISSQKRNQDVWPYRSATKYTWKHVNRAYKIDNMLLFEILPYI